MTLIPSSAVYSANNPFCFRYPILSDHVRLYKTPPLLSMELYTIFVWDFQPIFMSRALRAMQIQVFPSFIKNPFEKRFLLSQRASYAGAGFGRLIT